MGILHGEVRDDFRNRYLLHLPDVSALIDFANALYIVTLANGVR